MWNDQNQPSEDIVKQYLNLYSKLHYILPFTYVLVHPTWHSWLLSFLQTHNFIIVSVIECSQLSIANMYQINIIFYERYVCNVL